MSNPMRVTNTAVDFYLMDDKDDLECILEDIQDWMDVIDPREHRDVFPAYRFMAD